MMSTQDWSDSELDTLGVVSAVGPDRFYASYKKALTHRKWIKNRPVKHYQTLSDLLEAAKAQSPIYFWLEGDRQPETCQHGHFHLLGYRFFASRRYMESTSHIMIE
jgi:hypothetical protein